MHSQLLRSRFTFGDAVRFDSNVEKHDVDGKVSWIHFEQNSPISYLIEIDRGPYCDVLDVTEEALVLVGPKTARPNVMHAHSFQSKYTFHDRVRVDSEMQHRQGIGVIAGMSIDVDKNLFYMVRFLDCDDSRIQPGILESEITHCS